MQPQPPIPKSAQADESALVRTQPKPLDPLSLSILRIAYLFSRGATRARLRARLRANDKAIKDRKAEKRVYKSLIKPARIYEALIASAYSQMRFRYTHVEEYNDLDRVKRRKIEDRVQIERIHITYNPSILWFKLWTTRRTPFGLEPMLPVGVYVKDLISQEALEQLTYTCQRPVTCWSHPVRGVWLLIALDTVHGGIPERVEYHTLKNYSPTGLVAPLGQGKLREIIWLNLRRTPHVLIGGVTNSGKSNLMHVIICNLISRMTPRQLQVYMIDLKMVEFATYEAIPHLARPIVTELDEARGLIQHAAALVDERMRDIKGRARDIMEFNQRYPEETIPEVVIFIDEVADLKLAVSRKDARDIESALARIGNKGRAAGVHLVLSTQTPSVEVISSLIKSNSDARIAFRMPMQSDSRTILGYGHAADLPNVQGRALFMRGADTEEIQTPLCRYEDIAQAIAQAHQHPTPEQEIEQLKQEQIDRYRAHLRNVARANGELNGSLAASRLTQFMDISQGEARALAKWAHENGPHEIDGVRYEIVKERNTYRMINPAEDETALLIAAWREISEENQRLAAERNPDAAN